MRAFLQKLLWHVRYPWAPAWAYGRVRPLKFSVCTEAQIPQCVELFEQNGAHGVPASHREHYRATLDERSILTFVAEDESGVVATFGLQRGYEPEVVWLCYVLVRPEMHRRGVGLTLMLAALALLPDGHRPMSVAVSALSTALRFYQRLGFAVFGEMEDEGEKRPLAVLSPVTDNMSLDAREILEAAGATVPEPLPIPAAKPPPEGEGSSAKVNDGPRSEPRTA